MNDDRRADPRSERVLVLPRAVLMGDPGWQGVLPPGGGWRSRRGFEAVIARDGRFVDRAVAEGDRSLKQVIPYLVLRDGPRILMMRRTRAGADSRLHERWSIGVGGHLNPGDTDLAGGLRREWHEELVAPFTPRFRFLGLLNDDTTEVGAVHLGAVFSADARGRPVAIREVDKLEGLFVDRAAIEAVADRLESWSSLVLAGLGAD